MSTSTSVYDPAEDDEASDNASIDPRDPRSGFGTPPPPLQNLRLASASESGRCSRESSTCSKRSHSGSRAKISRIPGKVPVERYLDFFNASVKEAVNGRTYGGDVYSGTQNGIVMWTPEEKETLFDALARKGRNAVPQI